MNRYRMMAVLAACVMSVSGASGTVAYGASAGHKARSVNTDAGPGVSGGGASAVKSRGDGTQAAEESRANGTQESGSAVLDGVIQPQNLEAARTADQMIVVVGTGGCYADTYYYKKGENSWDMVWKEASIVGRGGITTDKVEGDGKTPAGTYGFTMAFGLKEDPGSTLPYHKIVKGDYWVDDSSSAYYNKLVNTSVTPKSWNSAENMAAASPYYNYALALDYNADCVPGKGSAIFLHCFTASADNGSAGCIRLPQEKAMELVQSATERTKIVIAEDINHLK